MACELQTGACGVTALVMCGLVGLIGVLLRHASTTSSLADALHESMTTRYGLIDSVTDAWDDFQTRVSHSVPRGRWVVCQPQPMMWRQWTL